MKSKRAEKRRRAKERRRQLLKEQKLIVQKLSSESASDVEYITQPPPEGEEFKSLQKAFKRLSALSAEQEETAPEVDLETAAQLVDKFPILAETDESKRGDEATEPSETAESGESESEPEEKPKLSNKKRKLRDRLTISQLKQVVERSDLVDLHDPNSADPMLLVHLKSSRNTVPVPDHWYEKRRYLQGRRGVEKPSFVLPRAIQDTGVTELRNTGKLVTLKQKQRQRMNPKLGRLDVDYQKLHSAFFRHMVKPIMTTYGETYYMGKENEIKYKKHRPGVLSKRLKNSLHMLEGYPPPYLVNMQRYGPPPSYGELKIPGLNSPIPPGCKYGYSEGHWGKPPVDERGYPMYGDPFGVNSVYSEEAQEESAIPLWGKIEENVAYEEDEGEDEEMEEEKEDDEATQVQDSASAPTAPETQPEPPSVGVETPEVVSVRKEIGLETPESTAAYERPEAGEKQLYRVLDRKDKYIGEKSTMGSSHTYNINAEENEQRLQNATAEKVSVALNEEELASLDDMTIRMKYEQEMKQKRGEKGVARKRSEKKGKRKKEDMDSFKF